MSFPSAMELQFDRLARFLRAVSFRLRIFQLLEFSSLFLSAGLVILLGNLFVPYGKELFPYLPFVYNLTAAAFLIFFLIWGLWRLAVPLTERQIARRIEEQFPRLHDDVTNALLLFRDLRGHRPGQGGSSSLIAAQIGKAAQAIDGLPPPQVIRYRGILRHRKLLLPLSVACGALGIGHPHLLRDSASAILHPFSTLPIKETFISIEPRGAMVLRGSSFIIRAEATGSVPNQLSLVMWPEDHREVRLNMKPLGQGRFTYRISQAQFSFRYQAADGRAASSVYHLRVVDPPELEKLKLTLTPPEYSRLPQEVRAEGPIEALKGTWVSLEAKATKPLQEGKMVFNQESLLPLEISGDRLKGNFWVFYPGTYSIQVKDDLGFETPNPIAYPIRLIPDQYPEGEIIRPAENLEVGGTEILPIIYTAKDDFGLTAVKLSYQVGGKEHSIHLKSPNGERSLPPAMFQWNLASLPLAAGDQVVYRLGVWDNDVVSGPKMSYSRAFSLTIRDERKRTAQEGEEAGRIVDALLNLLADQLEGITEVQALDRKMEEILKQVDRYRDRMEGKTERFQLDALRRNLASLKERVSEEPRETVTQEMERLALLAEDIAQKARMNELEALARELRNRQRRLIDSLNEFKGPLTQEGLDAVLKELKKLEDLLRSILEAMGKMATELPDELINSPEMKGWDVQDLFKELSEIQKKLMAGDLAGALEAAQRMLQALSQMMAAMARAQSQAQRSAWDRLQGEMRQQSGELDRILAEQKGILRETEAIDQEMKKKIEVETRKRLNRSRGPLQEALDEIERSLASEAKDSFQAMQRLLREGQLEKLAEFIRDLEKEFSTRPEERQLLEKLKKIMEGLQPDTRETLTSGQKERFPPLSSRQEELKDRTSRLQEKLEMLAQLFPGMDIETLKNLKEAGQSMGKASQKLSREDAPGAIPPEEQALRGLTRSQQAMQQMAQQMAQQMEMARWGQPLIYDPRPGWYYGPWAPMPTLPQPEVKRPIEKGYTGMDREEFDPPGKDAYRVPPILREKVSEALKEDIPSAYKKEVEKYFRGLTE